MTVHLVGAGCAGPLWMTLEGKRLLERADAVVSTIFPSTTDADTAILSPFFDDYAV